MKFGMYILKRKLENILMYPFILVGRLLAILDPLPAEYRIFYFFPFYHTGGAENVHASVVNATGGKDCIIFFTRRSTDDRFRKTFEQSGCTIKDISGVVDVTWLYVLKFIWRGKISGYINRQQNTPVVFNGQSNFGYKISPWIRKNIRQVELIHSYNTFSQIRIPFMPFITATVMISRLRIQEHLAQYRRLDIPEKYDQRIHFIQNAIELPEAPCNKTISTPIRLLFVGRGTPEKRPELFIELARQCAANNIPAIFTLAGEMSEALLSNLPPNLTATGNISNPAVLQQLYCDHHLLVIPSATEGFPIVLMEAMAGGCAVMATPVGDIPYHIQQDHGLLFSSTDADAVIRESLYFIEKLDTSSLAQLSASAKAYAFKNFGIHTFNQQYKAILQP